MAAKFYPILDQVDGVKDTFELPEAFLPGTLVLAYNGQVYDRGVNIASSDPGGAPPTVTLNFIPELDTHALMIIYQAIDDASNVRGFTYPPGGLLNDF